MTGPTEDRRGARIVRLKGDTLTAGEIRPVVEGAPLAAGTEIVRLKPSGSSDVPLYEVESLYQQPPAARPAKKGPAQVASDAYRTNWDHVFAAPRSPGAQGAPN